MPHSNLAKYIKQFPFLEDLPNIYWLPPGGATAADGPTSHPPRVDDVRVRIAKADATLMWRQVYHTGEGQWVGAILEDERGLDAKQGEYPIAVSGGRLDNYIHASELFVRQLFEEESDRPPTHLVWLTILAWYKRQSTADFRAGKPRELVKRDFEVTIYKAPPEGWTVLCKKAQLADTLLRTDQIIRGIARRYPDFLAVYDSLNQLAQLFEREVWLTGLRARLRTAKGGCLEEEYGSVRLLAVRARGLIQVVLTRPSAYVSFAANSSRPKFGFQSIGGSLPQAERLVRAVMTGQRS